jgi:hypothetical protein
MRPPLFVLAPPRSYTSVIGGMLGQHPQAYGLPEVNLSHGKTLGDMWDTISLGVNYASSGLLRLLAQLHDGEQSEETVIRARQWVMRRAHWTGARVFAHIQEAVGPDLMLVEKSPRNVIEVENLHRLHRIFPRAHFLHLTRHPKTQGSSLLELLRSYGADDPKVNPERTWHRAQTNILTFAADLQPGQYMRVKGETLLRDPEFYLSQICEWLDIDTGAAAITAMLHPETSAYAGIGPLSAPFGNDPNFLLSPRLDFDRLARISEPPLEGPVEWKLVEPLTTPVIQLAQRFGYA